MIISGEEYNWCYDINHSYPNQDEIEYDTWIRCVENWGIIKYMMYILDDMNCAKEVSGMRYIHTKDPLYTKLKHRYNKCLSRITNPFLYNKLAQMIEEEDIRNILYEYEFPEQKREIPKSKKLAKQQKEKKQKLKNIWVRDISTDLFNGNPKYIYSNLKTGECITSDNPNLLEELNAKKKKEKKVKTPIPKFNFKIVYNENK